MNQGHLAIEKEIYRSNSTHIVQAFDSVIQRKVIIKSAELSNSKSQAIINEFELQEQLNLAFFPKALKLETQENRVIFIREYIEGQNLSEFHQTHKPDLTGILKIGFQLAQSLGMIHEKGIIHKDICPDNILIDQNSGRPIIIDFDQASTYKSTSKKSRENRQMVGRLLFISPEQTGRTNKQLDYRSDLYSLGATLYYLIAGRHPFYSEDPLELIHAHIAKTPQSLRFWNADVPEIVDSLVLKLLEKNAEDRYQSAFGLQFDLEKILLLIELNRLSGTDIQLGERDYSGRFQISNKLLGREEELNFLYEALEKVKSNHQRQYVLIEGESGVGKTALVNHFRESITGTEHLFLETGFKQSQQNIPYSAWIHCIEFFVEYLLTLHEQELDEWKSALQEAVGDSGRLLIDLSPKLEWIIGPQKPLPIVGELENQNRFRFLFNNFLDAIAVRKSALILFLDDLQWADASSLALIQSILNERKSSKICFITAYSVYAEMPEAEQAIYQRYLRSFDSTDNKIKIPLQNIGLPSIHELIDYSLPSKMEERGLIAQIIYSKTKGNPYFIRQFLEKLHQENLLYFDYQHYLWRWEIESINKLGLTTNVIDLLSKKIDTLPYDCLHLLNKIAIAGHAVSYHLICSISRLSVEDFQSILHPAIVEGILYIDEKNNAEIGFIDERLRTFILSNIDQKEKEEIHLSLARILAKHQPDAKERTLFTIVGHYNQVLHLLTDQAEVELTTELNKKAAQLAKSQTAYANAEVYISAAISLVKPFIWKERYAWMLNLYNTSIEIYYILGYYERMESSMQIIEDNAQEILDIDKVYEYRVQTYKAQNQLNKAVEVGLEYLHLLGISLKPNPSQFQVIWEFIKIQNIIKKKTEQDLINAPFITDRRLLVIFQTYSVISPVAYFTSTNLLAVLSSKQIGIIAKYGNVPRSPYLLASLGFTYCGIMGDMDKGYYYGQVAQKISDKYDLKENFARTQFALNFFVRHWKEPIANTIAPLKQAYEIGLETGDFEHAAYSLFMNYFHSYFAGIHLAELHKTGEENLLIIAGLSQKSSYYLNSQMLQVVHNLSKSCANPARLEGLYYHADENFAMHLEANDKPTILTSGVAQIILAYYFNDYQQVFKVYEKTEEFLKAGLGALGRSHAIFFTCLAYFQYHQNLSTSQKRKYKSLLSSFLKTLKDWSNHTPSTYEHKYYLLQAEAARIKNNPAQAKIWYDKTLESVNQSGIPSMKALCWEMVGRFHINNQQDGLGMHYIMQALKYYENWGATNKKSALEQEFNQLIKKPFSSLIGEVHSKFNNRQSISAITDYAQLDLLSILKSSQAISGNIRLEQLLESLMKIVLENAGAERGFLFLQERNQWKVRVFGDANQGFIKPKENIFLEPSSQPDSLFSHAVLNYVTRTREAVVLDNAHASGKFIQDAYLQHNRIKSLICLPLINQGLVIAMLYLENNLSIGAFTSERLEILNMLTSQATISIENAMLYEYLEEKVEERTAEVNRQKEELETQAEKLRQTNLIVEKKNQDITASINYGSRIQSAMMPSQNLLTDRIQDSFVFFKPRDIVSGDFYWFSEHEDYLVIAAVDCTGHGVPGAFMSMIGIDLLNSIVNQKGITKPDEILYELNLGVSKALKKEDKSLRDGMDVALCTISKENGLTKVEYAGAKNPLVYIKNGELINIKADRHPIGDVTDGIFPLFVNHEIYVDSDTQFYIFSDGYQDQFGGPLDRKFMSNRFKELLFAISNHPHKKQKTILEDTLSDWIKNTHQIDDILVIGFGIKA